MQLTKAHGTLLATQGLLQANYSCSHPAYIWRACYCHMHAELLKASYVVKTQEGISGQSHSSKTKNRVMERDRGTKWATAAWVTISTLIIGLMPPKETGSISRSTLNPANQTYYGRFVGRHNNLAELVWVLPMQSANGFFFATSI
jgi:hypothetical protein